ncbi:2-acylglycerol O-acyltransferase 1 [Rhizoclosmatium sp. JEL0117]|nr:2-acylglycerol O-acyltransferase 1 [Rhizoclosmatium sp. JEL0117]
MLGARRESLPDSLSKSTPTLVLPSGYAFSDSEDDEDDEESNVLQTQPFQQPDTPIRKQSLRKRNSGVEESVSPPPNARVESLVDLETILATPGKLIMSYQDARILSPLDTIEVLPTSRKLHSVFNGVLDDDSDDDDIEELTGLPNERNKDLFIHSTRKLRDERRPLGQRLAAAHEVILPPLSTKFDPLSTTQLVVVTYWVLNALILIIGTPIVASILLYLYPLFVFPLIVAYCVWAYGIEGNIHNKGGWGRNYWGWGTWFSAAPVWHHFRHYFQAHLVKTADLPSDRNYIFSIHPHGVYLLGIFANITGNRKVFYETFGKGLSLRLATLPINFRLPGWREFFLSLGGIGVDRKSLEYVLTEKSKSDPTKGAGNIITLVVGGAEEFTVMEPKTMDLVLEKRKGFVKLALTTGASLVPVITFNENDTWKQSQAEWVKKVNAFTKKIGGFAFPAIEGRYGIPVIPFAAKLVTVVGSPIHVERVASPTEEQIDTLHQRYIKELFELYETYKDDFFQDRVRDMRLVK